MFLDPPPTLTEDFRKIDRDLFEKKPAAGEKFDGFSKNLAKNLGNPFLRAGGEQKIFRGPPKKIW